MDHSINSLGAAIKSLNDVVAPAVDPSDPLATEQLRLVRELLEFLRSRLPYLHDRSTLELRRAIGLGATLEEAAASHPEARNALSNAIAEARAVLHHPGSSQSETDLATARVGAEVRKLIRLAATLDEATRVAIERAVLADFQGSIDFYRAWYVPLGFDPRPESVPTVAEAIAQLDKAT